MAYLNPAQYKLRSVLPSSRVEAIEASTPGWLAQQFTSEGKWIDAQLAKRYAVPFDEANPPEIVQQWLTRIVDVRALLKGGVDQQDEQFEEVSLSAKDAKAEIKQAADSETGLYELPLKGGSGATAVSRGAPLCYSESSPYVGLDVQADRGRDEDRNGGGSYV